MFRQAKSRCISLRFSKYFMPIWEKRGKKLVSKNKKRIFNIMFCSSHFWFLVFGHFWPRSYENTKIVRNLGLHFARQDGHDGKKITQLKWPKYQKSKIWDEPNISAWKLKHQSEKTVVHCTVWYNDFIKIDVFRIFQNYG